LFPPRGNKLETLTHRITRTDSRSAAQPIALIEAIRARKMKVGVAISPDTPSTAITDEVANAADMLLVMTVYPGAAKKNPF
jgi:pentose-5-phosphate-3-epimerase